MTISTTQTPTKTSTPEESGLAGMLATTHRHFLLFFDYFSQYSKVRISYRGDFFISLATSFAATIFALGFVIVLFQKVPQLAGWRFEEVLFLYGFSLIPYGMFNIVSLNLYDFGNNFIIEGKFDRVLLRPISSLFQVLFETFRIESSQEIATGIFCMMYASRHLGLAWTPMKVRHAVFLWRLRRHHLRVGLPDTDHRFVLVRRPHRRAPACLERNRVRALSTFDLQRRGAILSYAGSFLSAWHRSIPAFVCWAAPSPRNTRRWCPWWQ